MRDNVRRITMGAMIAALYVALTYVFQPISFGEIQIRFAEALTILPVFTAAAIPGLFVGCILGNLLGGAILPDIVFGSLATLIGAAGTRLLRHGPPALAVLPPILSNTIVIPLVLRYAYGIVYLPLPVLMLSVGAGELVSCAGLGLLLHKALCRQKEYLFHKRERNG